MKKIKNILILLIISIVSLIVNSNNIYALEINNKVELYSKETIQCIKYNNMLVRSEFVVYKDEENEYPGYCLNRELEGVSLSEGGYEVTIQNKIENELVWKAIKNGYPNKTYQELGCINEAEAFIATKMAVYDMLYNYDLNDFEPVNEQGERVLNAMKKISQDARFSTEIYTEPNIQIKEISNEWIEEEINGKQYMIKKYSLLGNLEFSKYEINVKNGENYNIEIMDENNESKTVFECGEFFKILIPIEELTTDITIKIQSNASLKAYPVYYGKSPSESLQNYAIVGSVYKTVDTVYEDTISKIEEETKEPVISEEQVEEKSEEVIVESVKLPRTGY